MKKFSKFLSVLLSVCALTWMFSACGNRNRDYPSSGLKAKYSPFDFENDFIRSATTKENAIIFADFESFAAYDFPFGYDEEFFEKNDLLVFVASADPADEMQFFDILTYEGRLYPCFTRVKLSPNDLLYEDVICYLPYCAELAKTEDFKLGEVIYKYR